MVCNGDIWVVYNLWEKRRKIYQFAGSSGEKGWNSGEKGWDPGGRDSRPQECNWKNVIFFNKYLTLQSFWLQLLHKPPTKAESTFQANKSVPSQKDPLEDEQQQQAVLCKWEDHPAPLRQEAVIWDKSQPIEL